MRTILIGILIFVSFYCVSQDSTSVKNYKHEIGLDATYVLKSALLMNQYNSESTVSVINSANNNYVLTYNYNLKKISLRFGLGIDISGLSKNGKSNSNNDTAYMSGVDNQKLKRTYLYYRMGFQKSKIITKNWQWYYGFDIVSSYKYSYTNTKYTNPNSYNYPSSTYSETVSTTLSLGLGPILGLKFKLNDRISLLTETSLYYNESINITDTESSNSSSYSLPRTTISQSTTSNFFMKITVPVFIVITFNI